MQLTVTLQDSWPTPNFTTPETRGLENSIITCTLLPATILVVGLRAFTRLRISHLAIDDLLIVASLVLAIAYGILGLYWDLTAGWRHVRDYPVETLSRGLQIFLASQALYIAGSTLLKISILTFIRRLLLDSQAYMKNIIFVTVAAVITQAAILIVLEFFQCDIISDYWTVSSQKQQCLRESRLLLATGIANTIVTPLLFSLCLLRHYRLYSLILFSSCLFIILTGALRTHFIAHAVTSWDKLWGSYPAWMVGSIELYVGIICASIPSLQGLLIKSSPRPEQYQSEDDHEVKDDQSFPPNHSVNSQVSHENMSEIHFPSVSRSSSEIHYPSTSRISFDSKSQDSSHIESGKSINSDKGNFIIHYLQGMSDESMLSPIIEESVLSRTTSKSVRVSRAPLSHCSSISSFNVAQPDHTTNKTKPTKFSSGNVCRAVSRAAYRASNLQQVTSPSEVVITINRNPASPSTQSGTGDKSIDQVDNTNHKSSRELTGGSSSSQVNKLSSFDFERLSDWNRDGESLKSLPEYWNILPENRPVTSKT